MISFRIDWFDLPEAQRTLKSLLQRHSLKASILQHSACPYGPTLTSVYDYWKNHSLDSMEICWQSDASAFEYAVRFVIAFLPRNRCLLISWLSPSTVVTAMEPKEIKSVTASTFSLLFAMK